ncbi:MAG: adenylate kinase [Chlamydiia bacterium]|nr:adenylate kinase [Chlamydiia bacterium]MCH9615538.1 adenylate kinase [Chlamydiia bacterium]MCH9629193.1 adenylate kinase [Chlamydiia bacterium]
MSEKFKAMAIFGPPGSGKGTQSKVLGSMGRFIHLSTGDMFRAMDPKSEVGAKAHAVLAEGKLLSDEMTVDVWRDYVQSWIKSGKFDPVKQGLFLDGIPRTAPQVALIQEHVEIERAIVLEIPDHAVLIKRLKGRAAIEGRSDDMDDSVLERRLSIYEEQTAGVISLLDPSKVVRINGDQKPLEVLKDILNILVNIL